MNVDIDHRVEGLVHRKVRKYTAMDSASRWKAAFGARLQKAIGHGAVGLDAEPAGLFLRITKGQSCCPEARARLGHLALDERGERGGEIGLPVLCAEDVRRPTGMAKSENILTPRTENPLTITITSSSPLPNRMRMKIISENTDMAPSPWTTKLEKFILDSPA